jgi:paraquat-inducible protein B
MHGLVVGQVTSVSLRYDPDKDAILAPVRYEFQPERIIGVGKQIYANPREAVQAAFNKGLRAKLESASLITGQQMVTLEFVHGAPPTQVTMEGSDIVVPTTQGGGFTGLQASATALLDKVSDIPFKQIGENLDGILRAAKRRPRLWTSRYGRFPVGSSASKRALRRDADDLRDAHAAARAHHPRDHRPHAPRWLRR